MKLLLTLIIGLTLFSCSDDDKAPEQDTKNITAQNFFVNRNIETLTSSKWCVNKVSLYDRITCNQHVNIKYTITQLDERELLIEPDLGESIGRLASNCYQNTSESISSNKHRANIKNLIKAETFRVNVLNKKKAEFVNQLGETLIQSVVIKDSGQSVTIIPDDKQLAPLFLKACL